MWTVKILGAAEMKLKLRTGLPRMMENRGHLRSEESQGIKRTRIGSTMIKEEEIHQTEEQIILTRKHQRIAKMGKVPVTGEVMSRTVGKMSTNTNNQKITRIGKIPRGKVHETERMKSMITKIRKMIDVAGNHQARKNTQRFMRKKGNFVNVGKIPLQQRKRNREVEF